MPISSLKESNGSSALAPKYARLIAVIEKSARQVETGRCSHRPELVELQRRAISALQECAEVAYGLADCVGEQPCPRDVTCLHLGDWNRCNACFNDQVTKFFEQAAKFLTAVVAAGEPAPIIAPRGTFGESSHPTETFQTRAAAFTEAQQRVFELLVTGLPNKLIAYEIGVSEATVKAHVSAVLRKLKVRSRAQAIALSSASERHRNGHMMALG
jgi:DNA-binding CsgD family transcriptional regulator